MSTPAVQLPPAVPDSTTSSGSVSLHDGASINRTLSNITTSASHLDPHHDARSLVRFVQCSQCSYPFRTPVTLPCGNSLCRSCLPPAHVREHISYPATPSRESGIKCPFPECLEEHTLDDCSVDIVLLELVDTLATEIRKLRTEASEDTQLSLEEVPQFPEPDVSTDVQMSSDIASLEKVHARTLHGGRLVSAFTMAEMGELQYTSNVTFQAQNERGDDPAVDLAAYRHLQDVCRDRVDCHVCYGIVLEPLTTPCGHTFCRKCLIRSLDHSTLCPHCRRELHLSPTLTGQQNNKTLLGLTHIFWTEDLKARREAIESEEQTAPGGMNSALFVCTVSFPQMPMILHVFEPRYRLMIRRALEGNRMFGMVPYNATRSPQGNMGRTQFMEIGTMLYIEQYQLLPDGRSWLLCRGAYRFKVLDHGSLDGYIVGRTQRHDDMSLAEEERVEAEETRHAPHDPGNATTANDTETMSTGELFAKGHEFIRKARQQSHRWLQGSIQEVYGGPPEDPAIFPYWFASVVPLSEDEKYTLLPTTSVRERLKIAARWMDKIESSRWLYDHDFVLGEGDY